ncbi:MAG: helix-turn-helix transcriptional regulator [Erysipelotrichaceae bacterium]
MLTKKDFLLKVGNIIKNKRVSCGLTRAQLCKKASINEVYYRDLEIGNRNLSLLSLEKIAKGLNMSVRDLLDEDYEKEK